MTIYQGDALEVLKTLESESIDCCVTSPPYWALRDYKVNGQLGLESTYQEYLSKLVAIFDEVKRVLKKTGSCWVVMGDTYGGGKGEPGRPGRSLYPNEKAKDAFYSRRVIGVEKSLCLIPSRFAIMMVDNSWILRNEIIWYKRNAMPSSAKDRFTIDSEKVFFFVKSKKYYFETQYEPILLKYMNRYKIPFGGHNHKSGQGAFDYSKPRMISPNPRGRIKRTVWDIPTETFSGAHFAIFPEKLIETPIKAGCPVSGGIVLDPFMGSGTTGVVAYKNGREFIGIELNPEYIKLAEERLRPYTTQTRLVV